MTVSPDPADYTDTEADQISRAFALSASKDARDQKAADAVALACIVASRTSVRGACVGAAAFLDQRSEGFPEVDWFYRDRPRQAAAMWAASAGQEELEAYLAAAVLEMEKSPITTKAVKRLAALSYRLMDATERGKFLEWAGNLK